MARSYTSMGDELSHAEKFARKTDAERAAIYESLGADKVLALKYNWRFWARPKQVAPPGDWATWLLLAGRGFGKTRAGSSWVHERAMAQQRWIALIAKTPADARDMMIEGPGGFVDKGRRNIPPQERPLWEPSKRRLTWPNGSWATIYSDEEPEQLRGYSGDTAWADELGKFRNPQSVWDNLAFGMREASGDQPRKLVTTTPRPLEILREIMAMPTTVTVVGSSYENRSNLDPRWFAETLAVYEGTAFGRQEIHAELLDPEESGIIKRSWFKLWPAKKPLPPFEFVLISMDTAFTEATRDKGSNEADPTACGVYGLFSLDVNRVPGERSTATQGMGVMLLDCWEDCLGFPDLVERAKREMKIAYGTADAPTIKAMVGSYSSITAGRKPDLLVIEDKGSGISLRQQLAREDVPAYAYNPGRLDKLTRLHLVSHVVKAGMVWLVESETRPGRPKTWTEPLLAQLCAYTGEGSLKHDDHVDQFTQALRVMLDKHLVRVTKPDDPDPHAIRPGLGSRPLIQNPYAA